jgi:hypothetical protein
MFCMDAATVRDYATEAIRYWEPRRIVYNVVLASVVLIYFFVSAAPNRSVSFDQVQLLFLLCVLANIAYCAAYLADLFAQVSGFRERWRGLRWLLFVVGLAFAAILARFWSIALFASG